MFRKILLYGSCLAVLPLATMAIACGDDEADVGEPGASDASSAEEMLVEQTLTSVAAAYERQDMQTFLAFWTDEALEDQLGATRAQIQQAGPDFFAGPSRMIRGFAETEVTGNEATTRVEWVVAQSIQKEDYMLIREVSGGPWKIDGSEPVTVAIPSGTTAIDVDMDEFAYEFDMDSIKNGNVAFRADNIGEQEHELVLLQVPSSFTAQQLLGSLDQDIPAGVEILGFATASPAEETNLVFTQALAPGKYMMVCFLPDEDDPMEAPHAAKGMISEFTISAQGGN